MTRVVVIDYGMGNLHSVGKALESVAEFERVIISSDKEQLKQADKIVFPGVGAIKDCMAALSLDLRETVLEQIKNKPTHAYRHLERGDELGRVGHALGQDDVREDALALDVVRHAHLRGAGKM